MIFIRNLTALFGILFLVTLDASVSIAQLAWEDLHGPPDGTALALAADSSGNVYAFGGRYTRSICLYQPSTQSWKPLASLGDARAAAITPDRTIYVAVRENDTLTKPALIRSTDGGYTWTGLLTQSKNANAVAVRSNGVVFFANDSLLRVSDSTATTWKYIPIIPSRKSSLSNTAFVLLVAPNGDVYAGTRAGVFRTQDNGTTWDSVGSGLEKAQVYSLSIAPNGDFYAGTDSSVYRLRSGESRWTQMPFAVYGPVHATVTPAGRVVAVTYHEKLFVSDDNGTTWDTSTVPGLYAYSLLPRPTGEIFVGSALNDAFHSGDGGRNWTMVNQGMPAGEVESLTLTPTGTMIAGMSGEYTGRIMRSTDHGTTWVPMLLNPAAPEVWCTVILPNSAILVGTGNRGGVAGIYRSGDDGATWQLANSGLGNLAVWSLLLLPDGVVLAGTEGGLFRSSDAGLTWSASGLPSRQIWALTRHPSGRVVAGCNNGPVFYSDDAGTTWTSAATMSAKTDIQHLAVAPDGALYAASFKNGLYRSIDTARTWTKMGFDSLILFCVVTNEDGVLFVSGTRAVWTSFDRGVTWRVDTTGLPSTWVNNVVIDSGRYIYAATKKGLARAPLSSLSVHSTRNTAAQSLTAGLEIIPNPADGRSAIRFTLLHAAVASVSIYTTLGVEVFRLPESHLDAGEHALSWATAGMPAGMYFCRLHAGEIDETVRVVVER